MVSPPPQLPLRLASERDVGARPFREHLLDRTGGDRRLADRLRVFIEQWDVSSDELGRSPSTAEYAERWGMPQPTAYRQAEEFRRIFPSEDDPRRLLQVLWSGVGSRPRHLFSVEVVPEFEDHRSDAQLGGS